MSLYYNPHEKRRMKDFIQRVEETVHKSPRGGGTVAVDTSIEQPLSPAISPTLFQDSVQEEHTNNSQTED